MKETTESELLNRMASLCSMKEYCIQEIRKKTETSGLSADACERIINKLIAEKFIDEERYVRAYIKDKSNFNKWGRIKIKYELIRKGITPALSDTILGELDENEYRKNLKELLTQKKKSVRGKNAREVFVKLFRFAAGRGFESSLISSCLKEILNPDADDTYLE
ncbi:regulatory protein RecX [Massilibacteroides sp.]|uniref:regulatory protein RecX n=1 Tax=Massilibacteroides sp. TaxID=2034766 RepID=UPI002616234F|nr:regulatory protein RecX [Massilibacteroides sp.]MDD4514863.1 regulatory protein RecX [Massilibacteroides sp.]